MKLYNFLNSEKINKILSIYGIIIFLLSVSGYLLKLFPHNTVANIMPAIAPHLDLGKPYIDYWDVYPPGIYLFYYLFYYLGKNNFIIYNFLHIFMLSGTIFFAKHIFSEISEFKLIFYISLSYFLSPLYIYYLLPNELLGLFFSFLGLYIYLIKKPTGYNIALSNFFLFFASFIKEIFLVPAICIILYQIIRKEYKNFCYSALGLTVTFVILNLYISYLQIVDELFKSYSYKYLLFDIENIFLGNLFKILFILILFLIIQFTPLKKLRIKINTSFTREYVVYIYSFLMLLSYIVLNRDDGGHFDIPKIFVIFFFLTILLKVKKYNYKLLAFLLIVFISGYVLKFQHATYSYLLIEPEISTEEKSYIEEIDYDIYQELTNSTSEFLYLYGWGSTNYYYELEIKPYSKYWIVNPQIMTEKQILEFKKEIYMKAPGIIYYCGFNKDCPAGFDFVKFELKYINFKNIISNCYSKIDGNYFRLLDQACVREFNS